MAETVEDSLNTDWCFIAPDVKKELREVRNTLGCVIDYTNPDHQQLYLSKRNCRYIADVFFKIGEVSFFYCT